MIEQSYFVYFEGDAVFVDVAVAVVDVKEPVVLPRTGNKMYLNL